jgi:magnesium chelatase subunit I
MKRALLLNVVDPAVGGVLLMGERGTAKSTAVRALAALLPELLVVAGCPYHCPPERSAASCPWCSAHRDGAPTRRQPVPVVDLPLGATEDRVAGTLDLEAALSRGIKRFEPGLIARANRGFLYIDEVNLLEDHLVDLLLDVAASGEHVVERESVSVRHPATFVLIGTGNPEEGELRPQLLDRFGLCAEVAAEDDIERRIEITRRRLRFEREPAAFVEQYASATSDLRQRLEAARQRLAAVALDDGAVERIAALNAVLQVPGHRGELALARGARAHAALMGRDQVDEPDLRAVAHLALQHRLRRDPLESHAAAHRIDAALDRVLTHP